MVFYIVIKIVHQHVGEINELQQYSRRDCVEITGLPNEKDEDTDELIIKVGTLMGLNREACHPVHQVSSHAGPITI